MARPKKEPMPVPAFAKPLDHVPISRILKVGNCTNLSCKSNLTYHIGINPDKDIFMRVASNDGGGYFSPEWIALKAIHAAMGNWKHSLTSTALNPLFQGKSANSSGFLFAALYKEGLVERSIDNPRVYVACDATVFIAEMSRLIEAEVNIKVPHIPPGRKTAPSTKKPNSRQHSASSSHKS